MQIFIKTLNSQTLTIDAESTFTVKKLKRIISKKQGLPLDEQMLLFGGRELFDGETLEAYGIPREATLHLVGRMRGMISTFTDETDETDPKQKWLRDIDILPHMTPAPSEEMMQNLMREKKASERKTFYFEETGETLLPKQLREICMKFMDTAHELKAPGKPDCKMVLGDRRGFNGKEAFRALFGIGTDHLLEKILKYHSQASLGNVKIALRRSLPYGHIGWHCDGDYATQTVQYTLNQNYTGGNLCYYTKNGLFHQKRSEGTVTVHDRDILHAVTKLHSGVRYALFVVDHANGLGEKDVYSFKAEDIRNLMTPVKQEPIDGSSHESEPNHGLKRDLEEVKDVTENMRKRQKEENTVNLT